MTKPKSKNIKISKILAEKECKEIQDIFLELSKFSVKVNELVKESGKSKFQIAHEWDYKSISTLIRRLKKGISYSSSLEDIALLLNILDYKLKVKIVKK